LSKEDFTKLKTTYRYLIKKLHPDLHPKQSEENKELFQKVMNAYDNGDLELMEALKTMYELEHEDEGEFFSIGVIDMKLFQLSQMIPNIEREIEKIKANYPYALKELPEDGEKVKEIRAELIKKEEELSIYFDDLFSKYTTIIANAK
jgi:hypothetical protein